MQIPKNFFFRFWTLNNFLASSLMLNAILSQPDGDEDGLKWILIYVGALFRGGKSELFYEWTSFGKIHKRRTRMLFMK